MKILYVVVCSSRDYYCEQALLSILSLKKISPKSFITVLMDDLSFAYVKKYRNSFLEYVDELKVENFDESENGLKRSRYLKTNMRNLIEGNFLYVDVDTIWAEPYNEADFNSDVMAEYDINVLLEKNPLRKQIENTCAKAKMTVPLNRYYNSGVLYMADSDIARDFAKKWHDLWIRSCSEGVVFDQPALNCANYRCGDIVKKMSPYYNVQITFSVKYLNGAKILHYFMSDMKNGVLGSPFRFKQKKFWEYVKKCGVNEKVLLDVYSPKEAFDEEMFLIDKTTIEKWNEPIFSLLFSMSSSKKKYARTCIQMINALVKKLVLLIWGRKTL